MSMAESVVNSSTESLPAETDVSDQAAAAVDGDAGNSQTKRSKSPSHQSHAAAVSEENQSHSVNAITPPPTAAISSSTVDELSAADNASSVENTQLETVLRENVSLKDKVNKLKDLLVKSSKATRDIKAELDTHKTALDKANTDIQRLNVRVHVLSKRPTHLDWMADFEKNIERALWNVQNQSQSGGEDPSSFASSPNNTHAYAHAHAISAVDYSRLEHEIEQLQEKEDDEEQEQDKDPSNSDSGLTMHPYSNREPIHTSLLERIAILEDEKQVLLDQHSHGHSVITKLESELQFSKLEAERATRAMKEMQLEIDLITQSAMNANVRAAKGREAVEHVKSDKARIQELRNQVAALTEWAITASAAKEVLLEKNMELENQLLLLYKDKEKQPGLIDTTPFKTSLVERILSTHSSSVVIGAGMSHKEIVEFGRHRLEDNETVVLRWRFDVIPQELDICFSLIRGKYNDIYRISDADFIIRERTVHAGAGGENEGVFTVHNACTLIFSNEMAWVRPRAVNFTLEILAII